MTQVTTDPSRENHYRLYFKEVGHFKKRGAWMRNRRHMTAGKMFLDTTHEFKLCRGGVPFGRVKTMTGREARELNRSLEDEFAANCVAHPERRLWRWNLVDKAAAQEKCRAAAMRVGS